MQTTSLTKLKKQSLILLLFSLVGFSANGQVLISLLLGDVLNTGKIEFGLDGGLNLSTIDGLKGAESMSSFNLGFYFDIKTSHPKWLFHTGVIVKSTMGTKGLPVYSLNNANLDEAFATGSVKRELSYFNVPIMMKYKFNPRIYAEAGPMLGLLYKAYDKFSNKVEESEDLNYKITIVDQLHRIDAGMMAGVGYRLMNGHGMNLGIRGYYGLTNIATSADMPKQYNRSLYFVVGIPIGAGKVPKTE